MPDALKGFLVVAIIVAIIIIIRFRKKKKAKTTSADVAESNEETYNAKRRNLKVKGVSYHQDTLKALKQEAIYEPTFEKYEYNGEPAVKVLVNGAEVGNIAKEDLETYFKYEDRITKAQLKPSSFKSDEGETIYNCFLKIFYE